jgi:hypothetical protein
MEEAEQENTDSGIIIQSAGPSERDIGSLVWLQGSTAF